MKILEYFKTIFEKNDIEATINGNSIKTICGEVERSFWADSELEDAFLKYKDGRTKSFDKKTRILQINNYIEMPLRWVRDSFQFDDLEYDSEDKKETVKIIPGCSLTYSIVAFEFEMEHEAYLNRVKEILTRGRLDEEPITRIMPRGTVSASYERKSRTINKEAISNAREVINNCLFKIAIEKKVAYHLWEPSSIEDQMPILDGGYGGNIPKARYNQNLVAFYKTAVSSTLPSQRFLEFYHVLEYNFLVVFEKSLHGKLASLVNAISGNTSADNLQRIISLVQGVNSKNSSEEEMLKMVLEEYITADELANFIKSHEAQVGSSVYTKQKSVFGERLQIDTTNGRDPRPTAAATIKSIRNAIVHSSDKYGRSDRHIPLSDSDLIIETYNPLVEFMARKVIFGQPI